MKIIIVRINAVRHPMTISIIKMLMDLGVNVCVITNTGKEQLEKVLGKRVPVYSADVEYFGDISFIKQLKRLYVLRKRFWRIIDKIYDENSILFIAHNMTIKHLGKRLLRYKYILHLNELNETISYSSKFPQIKMNAEKIGNNALAVIVPQYDRAHIVKAFWKLKKLPYILPNKPYLEFEVYRNMDVRHSEMAREIINKLNDKKMIIYQGVFNEERNLDKYIQAVGSRIDEYALVIMTGDTNYHRKTLPENCFIVPFIYPPFHLEVTSHAWLGILSYIPVEGNNSLLNALYCAPNKIFEYSMFGIPMISNDVPALKHLFDTYDCGDCVNIDDCDDILKKIEKIERDYAAYSERSKLFYKSVDNISTLKSILADIV